MRSGLLLSIACTLAIALAAPASAAVGQRQLVTTEPTARLRDAQHRDSLRITMWYPAASDAVERPLLIGPPGKPLFDVGMVAPDAAFDSDRPHPLILLSHGFGGTARMMGWFGIAMARRGYVVAAVDHPGNNGADEMTMAGAVLWWDRSEDLRAALLAVRNDAMIGPRLDPGRVAVAGFSDGGFAALVGAGARVDPFRLMRFCRDDPDDGDCQPNLEFPVTMQDRARALSTPELSVEVAHAGDDHAIAELHAAFIMAPGTVQALDPDSLSHIHIPVHIVQGDVDTVEPPRTSGLAVVSHIPQAQIDLLPGVGHYDFLSTCTELGRASEPVCANAGHQEEAHRHAIAAAAAFLGRVLRIP